MSASAAGTAMRAQPVAIVGAGLAGALLAVLLARRGFQVAVYEKRADPRLVRADAGRSINLALAARGMRALERADLIARVRPFALPMRGRCIHDRSGATQFQPYGRRPHEVNYSVGRAALNRALIEQAAKHANVTLSFEHSCLGVSPETGSLQLRSERTGRLYEPAGVPTVAADGAGSVVRGALQALGHLEVREELLDHDYKELTVPAVEGLYALDPGALHIWPRGGFMLIALPNPDGTFTATLFLPKRGPVSFEQLNTAESVRAFFQHEFPDALPLIPRLVTEFAAHPRGELGTIYASTWHRNGEFVLLGDAAHAIVPFHGQGMNAAFEDCVVFDSLLDRFDDWSALFAEFERLRRADAEAIAAMAIENYHEMRDAVRDQQFQRRQALALELERRHPQRFIPRYSMVMFHPEIRYSEAQRRGRVQAEILDALDAAGHEGSVDFALAARLIEERLARIETT